MALKKTHLKFAVKRIMKGGECAGYILSSGYAKENYRVSEWGTRAPLPEGGDNIEDIVWHTMTEKTNRHEADSKGKGRKSTSMTAIRNGNKRKERE